MSRIFIKRGTRAQLDIAASTSALNAGEPYLITDENRLAVGISTTQYKDYPLKEEITDVLAPINVSPADNSTNIMNTVTLTGSNYYDLYGRTMSASQWQISTNISFTNIVLNTNDISSSSLSYSVTAGVLSTNTVYYWRVRYKNSDAKYSPWSTPTKFTTAVQFAPSTIGEAFGGGYYGGKINVSGTQYYLIVAPKSSGQTMAQFRTTNIGSTISDVSDINGYANTIAQYNASVYPAANFCKGLSIGGYTDWYLPARYELEVLYFFLKPTTAINDTNFGSNYYAVAPEPVSTNYTASLPAQTTASLFKSTGTEAFTADGYDYYWTSTDTSFTTPGAYKFNFYNGAVFQDGRNASFLIRAIRKIPV